MILIRPSMLMSSSATLSISWLPGIQIKLEIGIPKEDIMGSIT